VIQEINIYLAIYVRAK